MRASSSPGPLTAARPAVRVQAAAEITLIVGLILLIIWVVKPRGRSDLDLALRVAIGVLLVGSPWLHGDSTGRLGLRFDNLPQALAGVLPISLAVSGLAITAAFFMKTIDPPANWRAPYLRKPVPEDPWGRPYMYLFPGQVNTQGYDLLTYGQDGKPGGEGEDADILSWK
jgi:type II secretory pathway pseudopilin PulG